MKTKPAQKRTRRYGDDAETRAAQLTWTFIVAIGLAAAGLYQLTAPKAALMIRDQPATQVVKRELTRMPAGY